MHVNQEPEPPSRRATQSIPPELEGRSSASPGPRRDRRPRMSCRPRLDAVRGAGVDPRAEPPVGRSPPAGASGRAGRNPAELFPPCAARPALPVYVQHSCHIQ